MPPAPGDFLADHLLIRRLGGGGSSDVFAAQHPDRGLVAIKILRPDGPDAVHATHRFDREFTYAAAVADQQIVTPLDRGRDNLMRDDAPFGAARYWLSLQYVDGVAADALVPRFGEPDLVTISRVLVDIAGALDSCHRSDILHRDVKPTNILVTGTGEHAHGLLTDFGTAQHLTPPATVLLDGQLDISLPYAAPELLQARDLSPSTDGYAFAATAFEFLTGRTPFQRATPAATSYAHMNAPVPAPEKFRRWLPTGLTAVFAKALAKAPEQRYRTCSELATILRRTMRDVEPQTRRRR